MKRFSFKLVEIILAQKSAVCQILFYEILREGKKQVKGAILASYQFIWYNLLCHIRATADLAV